MMLVSDLSERELIARIKAALPPPPSWVLVGIGDDAAVIEPERGRVDVTTVDSVVEGIHFDRRFTPAAAIGHRALAVNLSDLAAMGATPRSALLSMALPAALDCADFDEIVRGLATLAGTYNVHVIGGNLTRSPGPLMLDVTLSGTAKRRTVLTRGGARAGDEIYVTGTIGAAATGLEMLKSSPGLHAGTEEPGGAESPAVRRYLYPEPRVRTGVLLGRNRAASACMDLSDGLADAVTQVAGASGVGAILDAAALPIAGAARDWFRSRGADEVLSAVRGGDDYELLVTVRPRFRGRLLAARVADVPFTRIGVCTADGGVRLRWPDGDAPREAPVPAGFSHFR